MVWLCLLLVPLAMLVALPATVVAMRVGRRIGAADGAGRPGQVKADVRPVPNTGGIGIFAGFALPVAAGLGALLLLGDDTVRSLAPAVAEHTEGLRERAPLAGALLLCLLALHVLGLIDDRRPLGPWIKLAAMALPALLMAALPDPHGTRMLTFLDGHAGGAWLSVLLTVVWFLAVTNAMNFMDNMDGLSAGVAAIASAFFLAAALVNGQWFVAACLALLAGSTLGFLILNFPPARVFMGDGGSLVIGFLLAFLTVRTTYVPEGTGIEAGAWYAVFMPLVVLAIPLYDMVSVTVLRLRQGRSPFVGDLQHLSHRLVMRGLSRRNAVLVIYGFTAVTGVAGISLASLEPWQAALVGVQTLVLLGVLAMFEWSSAESADRSRLGRRPSGTE